MSKYCKCKNKYVEDCYERDCKAPEYWAQGRGSILNQGVQSVAQNNRSRYVYLDAIEIDTYIDNVFNEVGSGTYQKIDSLNSGEELLYGDENPYLEITSDGGTHYVDTILNKTINNYSYYSRYKSGETTEGFIQTIVGGGKFTHTPSTQLFSNGLNTLTIGDRIGTITVLDIVDGYQWYKIDFYCPSGIEPNSNFRVLIASDKWELFYPSGS